MTAAELLMSESQERMMAFVHPDRVDQVQAVAAKWEIESRIVGTVKLGATLTIRHDGDVVAEVPAASLSENAPILKRPLARPAWMDDVWANDYTPMRPPNVVEALTALLSDPNTADPSWVYEQYDHMLFLNTLIEPGHDGSLLRLKGTRKGLAVSTDGNGRLCNLDPKRGAARIVWESALNVALTGAKPMAAVDNLNFGNPENPDVMWQFSETVDGLSRACRDVGIPVVGGNVSFYNTTDGEDIHPTPVVGVLGLADPVPDRLLRLDAAQPGDELWVFGPLRAINLAGSLTESVLFGHNGGRPTAADADIGAGAIKLAIELAQQGLVHSQHDISDGGLAVAAAEIAIKSVVGVTIAYEDWRHLFCEDPHRFLAAVPVRHSDEVADLAARVGINASRLGGFGGDRLVFEHSNGDYDSLDLLEATATWRGVLRDLME